MINFLNFLFILIDSSFFLYPSLLSGISFFFTIGPIANSIVLRYTIILVLGLCFFFCIESYDEKNCFVVVANLFGSVLYSCFFILNCLCSFVYRIVMLMMITKLCKNLFFFFLSFWKKI